MSTAHTDHGFPQRIGYEYDHVQRAPLYWLLMAPGIAILGFVVIGWIHHDAATFLCLGLLLTAIALSFRWLRVRDEGEYLALRYGPLPIFRKRFRYADIAEANIDRTSFADGWGIHWVPGRGWTYNLWGFDCVRLTLRNGRTARIGTDEPEELVAFLEARLDESS
ncbi:MAG: hypothetical protein U0805_07050 [Pirellulales bacterium]